MGHDLQKTKVVLSEQNVDIFAPQIDQAFDRVMSRVKVSIGSEAFQSWFGRVKLESWDRMIVRLSVPTSFLKSWINNHYSDLLLDLFKSEFDSILRVELLVRKVGSPASETNTTVKKQDNKFFSNTDAFKTQKVKSVANENLLLGSPLDRKYSFDNFVEGPSNRLALAAARSVADTNHNYEQLNPIFIHARVGLGKTHLLQAIASKAQQNPKYGNVIYLTAEYFMWRFATAIRDNKALSLKEQFRNIHLLIIDDLQFLQGKSIQNEFCHLLNMLLDSAKQIVVAADRAPADLESLDPRVRSRLQSGITLSIDHPDYDMRFSMLKNKLALAKQSNSSINIDDSKLAHIARAITGSGRDIEGIFNQVLFRQSVEGDLSIEQIDALLAQNSRLNEIKRIRIDEIQQIVAKHYKVSKNDLLSSRRVRSIVKPRQVAMYLAKILTPRSLPEIGRRFGGRDHTTVLHAIRKISEQANSDHTLGQEIELLTRLISEQAL